MYYGKEKYKIINENLNNLIKSKNCLISVHRGSRGGNIIENTIEAFQIAYAFGADMVELDIAKSTDGILYCFHDTTEPYNLGINRNIQTLPSSIIDEFKLINSIGVETEKHVVRFEEVLKTFTKPNQLINIDRCFDSIEKLNLLLQLLDKYPNCIQQVLYKSPVKEEVLEIFNKHNLKYIYIPIVYSIKDFEILDKYENINIVGAEVIIRNENSEFLQNNNLEKISDKGIFIWLNGITLGDGPKWSLSNFWNDDTSVIKGPEYGWKHLLDLNAKIIQTDWPHFLKEYIQKYFNK